MSGTQGETVRHCGVQLEGNLLNIFYTRVGDAPERILRSTCRLSGDWRRWRASAPTDIMKPTEDWEGTLAPVTRSQIGTAAPMEHALRDPFPFRNHLFYAAGGESAIGIAQLE